MKKKTKIIIMLLVLFTFFSVNVIGVKAAEKKDKNFIDNIYMLKKKKKKDSTSNKYSEDNLPTLGNLLDKNNLKYKVNCNDYYYAQLIWRTIVYAGPFIYIIFASFDFFKIVMAGNEEDIKKAKKNIPVRLILFVIFLIVPALVRIIAVSFGNTNPSVFKCIVGNTIKKPASNQEANK